MRLSKATVKKIIGYLSSILVLIFLGEPIVSGVGTGLTGATQVLGNYSQ